MPQVRAIRSFSGGAGMKTVGTLEEIGAQVGDVVEYVKTGVISTITRYNGNRFFGSGENPDAPYSNGQFRIVTRAAKSPVRTVTRKEIVPGVYGDVEVYETGAVSVSFMRTVEDLTAAIATLTEIRDAMAGGVE
jgi:hypothetical protein